MWGIVFHNDGDGICSAALFIEYLRRKGEKHAFALTPHYSVYIGKYILEKIKNSSVNKIAVFDITYKEAKKIEGIKPILLFDHHSPHPYIYGTQCTSFLVYDYLKDKIDLEDLKWVVVLGALSDKDEKTVNLFWKEIEEKEEIKRAVSLINSGKIIGYKGGMIALNALLDAISIGFPSALFDSTPNTRKLKKLAIDSKRERDKLLKKFLEEGYNGKNLVYFVFSSKYQIQGYLAGTLASLYPNKMVFCINKMKKFSLIEARTRSDKWDLAKILEKWGGGHKKAAGGKINNEELDGFLEYLKGFDSLQY